MSESGVVYKTQVPTLKPVEHQTQLEKKRKQNCLQQRTVFCLEGTIETTGER